jgi:vancomycin resistance protein VanJ
MLSYPLIVLLLSLLSIVTPQRAGWLAVAQIFGLLLFFPLLLLVPVAFMRGMAGLRVVLLLCAIVFGIRYMPPLNLAARSADAGASQISMLTWNVFAGNSRYDGIDRMLATRPADVVLLQEADSEKVNVGALATIYPYTLTGPDDAPPGMIFLSTFPILAHGMLDGERTLWDIPRLLWVRLDLGNGGSVTVVGAHPMSAYIVGAGCTLPICYSPGWRDKQIEAMRDDFISPMVDSGDAMIVAGDFNITEREPAYADLSRGLTDSWKAVGLGFGTTWRPELMMGQELGLLRIDYLFASPNVRPLAMSVDCAPRGSDHCVVTGRFETGK